VIVPLRCGLSQAQACLQGIAAQPDQPTFEVIVVDDASAELEPLLGQLAGDVEVRRSDRRLGFSRAVTLGLGAARGDIIILLRGGAAPDQGWLPALVRAAERPEVGVAFSITDNDANTPALLAWSAALRREHLDGSPMPDVDDDLVLGTLGLSAGHGLRAEVVADASVRAPAHASASAGVQPGDEPELTIVIPTLDVSARRVRHSLQAIAAATDAPHQVVVVDNGSAPQGFAGPVNAGLRAARTPYLVVVNDDVEPEPGWWPPLRAALDGGAAVAFPLTVDGAMRTDFAAWCFATTRTAMEEFGHGPDEFFDPSLVIWFQDTDLLVKLRRAGRPPVLVTGSTIRHGLSVTVGTRDPRLSAWVRGQIESDQRRFATKHPTLTVVPQPAAAR
jgi:GT2 family glycosyltransferase